MPRQKDAFYIGKPQNKIEHEVGKATSCVGVATIEASKRHTTQLWQIDAERHDEYRTVRIQQRILGTLANRCRGQRRNLSRRPVRSPWSPRWLSTIALRIFCYYAIIQLYCKEKQHFTITHITDYQASGADITARLYGVNMSRHPPPPIPEFCPSSVPYGL